MTAANHIDFVRYKLIAPTLGIFGYTCVKLGDWPNDDLEGVAIEQIKAAGGVETGRDGGLISEFENIRFQINNRRIRLCCEEYGDVTLWGAKRLVLDLAKKIRARMSESGRLC